MAASAVPGPSKYCGLFGAAHAPPVPLSTLAISTTAVSAVELSKPRLAPKRRVVENVLWRSAINPLPGFQGRAKTAQPEDIDEIPSTRG